MSLLGQPAWTTRFYWAIVGAFYPLAFLVGVEEGMVQGVWILILFSIFLVPLAFVDVT